MEQLIVVRDERGVLTVTLNRPEVHNAFDDTLIRALTNALEQAARDPNIRIVVLTGAGKSFSAGADLKWMQRIARYTEEENYRDAMALAQLMATLDTLPKPTIARVNGSAFGGGAGLVACCDIALSSESAQFALTEVRLGLIPAVISPYVVATIGERMARRYFLTAERFGAQEARAIGLIHEAVPTEELDETVHRLTESILQGGPAAQTQAKDLIASVAKQPVTSSLCEDTARRIARIRVSAEGQEGISAFLQKRPPDWIKR